jgi:hypothetical protein
MKLKIEMAGIPYSWYREAVHDEERKCGATGLVKRRVEVIRSDQMIQKIGTGLGCKGTLYRLVHLSVAETSGRNYLL